jgi:VanZ family protein
MWAVLIFLASSKPVPSQVFMTFAGADKLVHAAVYGTLAVLLLWAMLPSGGSRPSAVSWHDMARRAVVAVVVATAYGATDEIHQAFVPGRTPSVFDLLADAVGATVAMLAVLVALLTINISSVRCVR